MADTIWKERSEKSLKRIRAPCFCASREEPEKWVVESMVTVLWAIESCAKERFSGT